MINESNLNGVISTDSSLNGSLQGSLANGIDTIYVNDVKQDISGHTANITITYEMINDKPDVVIDSDYVHTDNNYTTVEKEKLSGLENYDDTNIKNTTGSIIELDINSENYVVTVNLKNRNGEIISTDNIDLPLESVVVNGRYDNSTKKIILTLKNGNEIEFSVADLVSGLQSEITSNNKLSSDLVSDTNNINKFMSVSEKEKLASLNNYDDTELRNAINNKQDTLESGINIKTINNEPILGSGNITIQGGGSSDYSSLENKPKINNVELNGNKSLSDLGIDQDFVKDSNYVHTDNNYTSAEKTKLSELENYDDTEIKQDISSLSNTKADKSTTYTKTEVDNLIPTVPTNVGAFTNDVGYLTSHQDISGKLDSSKVKTTTSTTAGDVYDVTYINSMLGDIETLLGGI